MYVNKHYYGGGKMILFKHKKNKSSECWTLNDLISWLRRFLIISNGDLVNGVFTRSSPSYVSIKYSEY